MPEAYPIQTNFTAGEVSPYIRGRVDITKYFNGVERLQNFIVKPQGGITRRSGTRFVIETKDSSKLSILVRFEFSSTQAFQLEFGDEYIRFVKDGAQVLDTGVPVEVVSPYLEAHLRQLSFSQSADVIYICHPLYQTRTLSRISDTNWVLALFETKDGPYLDIDTRDFTMTLTSIVNRATLKSTANDFSPGDVNKFVEYPYKTQLVIAKIITYVSQTEVVIEPYENIVDVTGLDGQAVLQYQAGSPSNTSLDILFDGTLSITPVTATLGAGEMTRTGLTVRINRTGINTSLKVGEYIKVSGATQPEYNGTFVITTSIANQIEYTIPSGAPATPATGTIVVDKQIGVVTNETIQFKVKTSTGAMNVPSGTSVSNPSTFANRIRSSLAIWTQASENSYIRVDGVWYFTGKHYSQSEPYTASPGGQTVSADVIEVTSTPTMVITSGILSFSDHEITAQLNCSGDAFASTDVGRQFRLEFSSEQVWGTVVTYTSSKIVQVELGRMMPPSKERNDTFLDNAKTLNWRYGAWFTDNYPSCSTFHEERLMLAGTPLQPQTVWGSKSSDYVNFAPTNEDSSVSDDSALTYTMSSSRINSIVWMMSSTVLIVGTIGAEWQTKASTINQPITPTNLAVVEQTSYGSSLESKPTKVGSSVFFIQRSGNKLRELFYEFQTDSYKATDLTVLSEHILRKNSGVVQSAYQKEPSSIYWMATTSGTLVALTYEKDQEVFAWHNHVVGGSYSGGNAVVESVSSTPSNSGKQDDLYIIVKRTIDGTTKRYIEMFEQEFKPLTTTDKDSMFFVDSGLSYNGVAVSTFSGLDHLEGQTVQVVANGSVRPTAVVNGGEITIQGAAATIAHVGLDFTSLVKTLPIEAGSQSGTAQNKIKRIHKIGLRLLESLGFKYGVEENALSSYSFREISSPMDVSPPLFSGDKSFDFPSDYDKDGSYFIVQDQPYPLTILSLMPQMQTNK